MKMEKLTRTVFGGLVIILTPFAAAQASSINVTYSNSAVFGGSSVGYDSGYISSVPDSVPNSHSNIPSTADVYIGGDSLKTANTNYFFSSTGVFNAWCVDIYHWMTNSATYDVATGSDLAADLNLLRGNGAARVGQLIQLADEVYSTINSKTGNAAFQLAVWAITYATPDAHGNFQVTKTDPNFRFGYDPYTLSNILDLAVTQANTWLKNLAAAPVTGNYSLTYLTDGNRENTQDLVVFTPQLLTSHANLNTVPEPATLALLSLGLAAGLGFTRRKIA